MWKCAKCGAKGFPFDAACPKCGSTDKVAAMTVDVSSLPVPAYLKVIRVFAGVNLTIGILAALILPLLIIGEMNRASYQPASGGWLVALLIALEGFLAYGVLHALADIAENMRNVGAYVRELQSTR